MTSPVKLVRVIARLNVGGPAIQAITLTRRLEQLGYSTTLVRGQESEHEGNMNYLAAELGVRPVLLPLLRRDPGWHDFGALAGLIRIVRRTRPALIHTHAAKGGTLGRLAGLIAFPARGRRPKLVHTFHGHSLTGYFSPRTAAFYRFVERVLASRTDRLIAVSEQVRDDLVALGVAPFEKFEVIPLGLDLGRFAVQGEPRRHSRERIRSELGIAADETVITLIARLVPIKRVDRFLRASAALLDLDRVRLVVVGDGELREELQTSAEAQALGARLVWTGLRRDIADICFASDVVVLTSDQEGTPVSLIEAGAAGVPTVTTAVGGAARVVRDGETGILVPRDDEAALAAALRGLVHDERRRDRMGHAAREHVLANFGLERLIADLDALYRALLSVWG
jgi:glycosyltransferase involved in cell wall biosynthesis